MQIALGLLETRARSESELASALARKGVSDDLSEQVLRRLRELGYVDDVALARALTASKVRVSRRGRSRIRQELRAKGLSAEVVADAVDEIDPEDEWAAARQLAIRRAASLAGLDVAVAARRLHGMLARRGFGQEICLTVSREVLGASEGR